MSNRAIKLPSTTHPITIEHNPARVVVRVGNQVVADSVRTQTLWEASYPAVQYIPYGDVVMAALERSTHRSHCPYKGDAAYFDIKSDGTRVSDAAWTYEHANPAVASIEGHIAFYPDRVGSITEQPAGPASPGEPAAE